MDFEEIVRDILLRNLDDDDSWVGLRSSVSRLTSEHFGEASLEGVYLVLEHILSLVEDLAGHRRKLHVRSAQPNQFGRSEHCLYSELGSAADILMGFLCDWANVSSAIGIRLASGADIDCATRERPVRKDVLTFLRLEYPRDSVKVQFLLSLQGMIVRHLRFLSLVDHVAELQKAREDLRSDYVLETSFHLRKMIEERSPYLFCIPEQTVKAFRRSLDAVMAMGRESDDQSYVARAELSAPESNPWVVTVAPSRVCAFAGTDLILTFVDAVQSNAPSLRQLDERLNRLDDLLTLSRPCPITSTEDGLRSVSSFTSPDPEFDQWPASVPECESLLRLIVAASGECPAASHEVTRIPFGDDILAVQSLDEADLPMLLPRLVFQMTGSNKILTWLLYPSTLGSVTDDRRSFVRWRAVLDAVKVMRGDAAGIVRARKFRGSLREIASGAAGVSLSAALVQQLWPDAPHEARVAIELVCAELSRRTACRAMLES